VLVSDGITDARGPDGERFGEPRVIELVEQHRLRPPSEIVNAVFSAVSAHSPSPADDRTLVVLLG
jgi:serine phosphatase RsbU (regulator of sigma subunit)